MHTITDRIGLEVKLVSNIYDRNSDFNVIKSIGHNVCSIGKKAMTNKAGRIFYTLILTLLSAVICYQTYLTTNDYIRQWRMPIWRLRHESSFNRSAVFLFIQ